MKTIENLNKIILNWEMKKEVLSTTDKQGKVVECEHVELIGSTQVKNVIYVGLTITIKGEQHDVSVELLDVWGCFNKITDTELKDLVAFAIKRDVFSYDIATCVNDMIETEAKKTKKDVEEIKKQICEHGLESGELSQLIYYDDLNYFYNMYKKYIDKNSKEKMLHKKIYNIVQNLI